jgi:putative ABC transport system permease protein
MPLGLQILLHAPARLAVSMAGIVLAVVLMFSQAGFRNAMFDSQSELIRQFNGDLFLISRLRHMISTNEPFASRRIEQARNCEGVAAVSPVYINANMAMWQNPRDGSTRLIRVLAFDPDASVLNYSEVTTQVHLLKAADTVLFDELSRDYYGRPQAGTVGELAGRRVTVTGTFRLGTDFVNDGTVIMSDHNYLRFMPDRTTRHPHLNRVEVGVVRLAQGADLPTVRRQLREALPDDVRVVTKEELVEVETRYWRANTPIGFIFNLGMVVGFVIGIVICYQILYTNVRNYLPQFATMKAMGFTNAFLVGVVLQQSLVLAVLGFIPGLGVAQLLFWIVADLTGLLMKLTVWRAALIFVFTLAMCIASGLIAVRKVVGADPAEVFR